MIRHKHPPVGQRQPIESYEAQPGSTEGRLFRISLALIVIGFFFLAGLRIAN
jgi:hypothetical protein